MYVYICVHVFEWVNMYCVWCNKVLQNQPLVLWYCMSEIVVWQVFAYYTDKYYTSQYQRFLNTTPGHYLENPCYIIDFLNSARGVVFRNLGGEVL